MDNNDFKFMFAWNTRERCNQSSIPFEPKRMAAC
jgi:hypothetical protein